MNVNHPHPSSNVPQIGVQPHPPTVEAPNPNIPAPPPLPPNPNAFQKKETPGLIDVQVEGQLTKELIEDIDPQTLLQNTEKMPSLQSLLDGGVALKHVETVEKTGLESAKQEYRDHKKDLRVLSQTDGSRQDVVVRQTEDSDYSLLNTDGLKLQIRQFSRELNQEQGNFETSLQTQFSQSLRELSKTDKLLFKDQRKVNIDRVLQETQTEAKNWIQGLGSDHNLSVLLKVMPEAELRMYVTKMVGDLKGYSDEERKNLSDKKERFIHAIVAGIKEGLTTAQPSGQPGSLALRLETMQTEVRQTVQGSQNLQQELPLNTRKEMGNILNKVLGEQPPLILETLCKGIESASPNQVGDKVEIPNKTGGQVKVPGQFTLNGKNYAEPKFLGEGGFAYVIRYKEVGTENYVAVKLSKVEKGPEMEREHLQALQEIRAHKEILGSEGHTNVIGLEGALKGPQDQLLIVQELAPGGDLREMVKSLNGAMESGSLSFEHRQLLALHMFQGVLQGARHMETLEGHHFDLKLENFMLGGDMQSKMIDFGMGGVGQERMFGALTGTVDNPIFKAPERAMGEGEKVSQALSVINQHIAQEHGIIVPGSAPRGPVKPKEPQAPPVPVAPQMPLEPIHPSDHDLERNPLLANRYMAELSEYTEHLVPKYQEDLAKYQEAMQNYPELKAKYDQAMLEYPNKLETYNQAKTQFDTLKAQYDQRKEVFETRKQEYDQLVEKYSKEGMGESGITAKSDNWAVGMMGYELLVGNLGDGDYTTSTHEIWQNSFFFETQNKLVAFGQGNETLLPKEGSSLGETPTVRLINSLMMPKGEDRVSFEGALQSSVFQDPRLQSQALPQILDLLSKNPFPRKPGSLNEDEQRNPDLVQQHRALMDTYTQQVTQWKTNFEPQLTQLLSQLG